MASHQPRAHPLVTLVVAGVLIAPGSRADHEVPGLLFQGGTLVPPLPVVVDPRLPRGPRLGWTARPPSVEVSCSLHYPVCVHGGHGEQRTAALVHLERAYNQWSYVLRMPAPLADVNLGGGPQLDVYLTATAKSPLTLHRDPPRLAADQSSGFCSLDQSHINANWLTLCVAEVASLAIDAATGEGMRRGWARHQIQPLFSDYSATLAAVDTAQANPQAPLLTRELSPLSDAAALFWAHVDASLGGVAQGQLPLALQTLSRSPTTATAAYPEWDNSPDELDVLRRAFDNNHARIAAFWLNFAVARAFIGNRADRAHVPNLSQVAEAGRIRFDWTLPYSSLPRHVAGPYPLAPLGATYIWVELNTVPLEAQLGFRAEWEQPVQFEWAIVSVDAQGRAINQWTLPHVSGATSAEKTLLQFQGAAGLLIVGINLGAIDVSHPFDPDQEPWEPHGYSVYLTELTR